MVDDVERQLGPVDLLVNNAGILGPIGPMWEIAAEEWWQCIETNLRGPFLCSRAVLRGMTARRRGRMVITSSSAAHSGRQPYEAAYGISKTAVIRWGEFLAAETREHGISVFTFNPAFARTAMTGGRAESPEDQKWRGWSYRMRLAQGRDAPQERAARPVLLLASAGADALSGCYINVRDDVTEMVRRAEEIEREELYTLRLRT
jgi:NAD(P)-dependent dehydrogenase (short-subunit alcohol dehydrogenase family)